MMMYEDSNNSRTNSFTFRSPPKSGQTMLNSKSNTSISFDESYNDDYIYRKATSHTSFSNHVNPDSDRESFSLKDPSISNDISGNIDTDRNSFRMSDLMKGIDGCLDSTLSYDNRSLGTIIHETGSFKHISTSSKHSPRFDYLKEYELSLTNIEESEARYQRLNYPPPSDLIEDYRQ
jgi:hypothetical protein